MRLPLFPLELFLLPGGISKLRIFEPRYLRLVSIASAESKGFVLCQPKLKINDQFEIGVHCTIEDFEQLDDGMLGITIKATKRVSLTDISQADDKLFSALATALPAWPAEPVEDQQDGLSDKLKQVLSLHSLYNEYPASIDYQDENWVVSRWLELLPFSIKAKKQILHEEDFSNLKSLVHQLVSEITIETD